MDGFGFDAWTRRTFSLAIGGGVAALLSLNQPNEADAKKKKKKRCRRVEQPCGGRKKCCKDLHCDVVGSGKDRFCCRDYQQSCSGAGDQCCRTLFCGEVSGLSGLRCCAPGGVACKEDADCCAGNVCTPDGTCGD